jgi:heme-degrading monooxygenase HmoA
VTGRLRVLLYLAAPPADPADVEAAYHTISKNLAGTPGLAGNELMRSVQRPTSYLVMSEWDDREAFYAWEQSTGHRETTAPLRPYQEQSWPDRWGVYEVLAAY